MVAAGKKAALTRQTGTYAYSEHTYGKPEEIVELAQQVRDFILGLDASIEEAPKKFYVAYKTSQNIMCMEIKTQKLLLYVKLDPTSVGELPAFARDVRSIGHFGTGDLELSISSNDELENCKPFLELAYQNIGA